MSKIVNRTLDFFELFAEHKRPLSLSEISRLLRIPASSCHDVLKSLEQRGYVYELQPRRGYYPTRALQLIASQIAAHDPVLIRAEAVLREMRDILDESVSLAQIDGAEATYLLVLEPSHSLRFLVRVGEKVRALHATSAGKAVLGSLERSECEAVLDALTFEPLTEQTIRTRFELEEELRVSRSRGYYLNREESVASATTVSARFNWNDAGFIITVAGPTMRIRGKLDKVIRLLAEACRRLENPV